MSEKGVLGGWTSADGGGRRRLAGSTGGEDSRADAVQWLWKQVVESWFLS